MAIDNYLSCVAPCLIEGNFTNHGPYITEFEKILTEYLDNKYFVAIYGSSSVGTAVGVLLAGGLKNYKGCYSVTELNSLLNLLNMKDTNASDQEKSCELRVYKEIGIEQFKGSISDDVSIYVINGLSNSRSDKIFHSALDYSIILLKDLAQYQAAVSMRSSYGVGNNAINVVATLNGRPSELVGQALLQLVK